MKIDYSLIKINIFSILYLEVICSSRVDRKGNWTVICRTVLVYSD